MKKLVTLFVITAAVLTARAQNDIIVDPNAEVRTLSGSFHAIKISGGMDLYLSQSSTESIAVSASEERYKAAIKTVVENGTLRIYYEGEKLWGVKNRKLKVYLSFRDLDKIDASGATDVHVAGTITVPSLDMVLSGACDFKGAVKVDKLNMDLSGASDVKISGSAVNVKIESSGASDVKGFDLVSEFCTAKASGASDINITVNKELNAYASGASDIYFKGSGLIRDLHNSGASNVSRKN